MNFQFAIIFGCDYEGENADSLQLLENLNQVDDIIEQEKGWYDSKLISIVQWYYSTGVQTSPLETLDTARFIPYNGCIPKGEKTKCLRISSTK